MRWWPIVGLLAAACAAPTEVVVLVDSDLPLAPRTPSIDVEPGQLRFLSITLECLEDEGDPPCDIEDRGPILDRGFGQDYTQIAAGVAPPFYLGLLREGDVDRRFRVQVEGLVGPESAESVVRASGVTRFVDGHSKVMTLVLYTLCLNATCSTGETCGPDGGCVSEEQLDLPEWTGDCTDFSLPAADGSARDCVERARLE